MADYNGKYEVQRQMLTQEEYEKIRQCVLEHLARRSSCRSWEELEAESFDRLGFAAAIAEEEGWIYDILVRITNNVCLGLVRRARTCDGVPLRDAEDVMQTIQERVFKKATFFLCKRENTSVGSLIGWIQTIGQNAVADEVKKSNRRIIREEDEEKGQNVAMEPQQSENEISEERQRMHRAALLGLAFLLRLKQAPYITMTTVLSNIVYPRKHAWEAEERRIAGIEESEPVQRSGRSARSSGYPTEVAERYGSECLYDMRQGFLDEVDEMLQRMLNSSLEESAMEVIDERLDQTAEKELDGMTVRRPLGDYTLEQAGGSADNISRWTSVVGKRMRAAKKQIYSNED